MQSNPRILVNLLVISVRILVNLLVKLTKLVNLLVKLTRRNPGSKGGCHGAGAPGMTTVLLVNGGNHRDHMGLGPKTMRPWDYSWDYGDKETGKKRLPLYDFHRSFRLSWEIIYFFHVAVRLTTCFFFRLCPPGESDNKRRSARRGEFDSSTPEAIGVLLGQVFLAYSFWSSATLETSPDKKMGVGSLHTPRGYDGRPPPDAGYYLDLVIPRFEE